MHFFCIIAYFFVFLQRNCMIMEDFFSRSEALLGPEGMDRLRNARVILFGVGGVGSWCAEALIRTGLTHLTIVDGDVVQSSNVNRQLPATRETIGRPKVEVLRERLVNRGTDSPEAIEERIAKAEEEMAYAPQFDYILVNDDLKTAYAESEKVVEDFLDDGRLNYSTFI